MQTKLDPSSIFLGQALELKASGAGRIEGLASVYGEPDSYGDIVRPGAFSASLAEHKAQGSAPLMLWAHDTSRPIGRWEGFQETRGGLAVNGQLNLKTSAGKEAFEHLRSGDLNGLSIGFMVPKGGAEIDNTGARILKAVSLAEISVVAIPAAKGARVTEVKSQGDVREILKHAGLPDRAARKMALGAFAALEGRDPDQLEAEAKAAADQEQLKAVARMLRQTSQRM